MENLKAQIDELKAANKSILSGAEAFKLHDTYGFPLDLTIEIMAENAMDVDLDGFHAEMEQQRHRARSSREDAGFSGAGGSIFDNLDLPATKFLGYDTHIDDAKIVKLVIDNQFTDTAAQGQEVMIILDKSPFYPAGGGQHGDRGVIKADGTFVCINDCIRAGGYIVHKGTISKGSLSVGGTICASIDSDYRENTQRHHSATHMLQNILRNVLGDHVQQAGSQVTDDRLRFDFTHFSPCTADELAHAEQLMNDEIARAISVISEEMSMDAARAKGATALFGEKYSNVVRVVEIGGSIELCGGTHTHNTADIGLFKILSESGISAGVRRIEAVCGKYAFEYYHNLERSTKDAAALLKTSPEGLAARIEQLLAANKEAARELEKLKAKDANSAIDDILAAKQEIGNAQIVTGVVSTLDANALRTLGDALLAKLTNGVAILASPTGDTAFIVVMASPEAVKNGIHCGNIVKAAAQAAGGGGGGRPNMAQAGIATDKIETAMAAAKAHLS